MSSPNLLDRESTTSGSTIFDYEPAARRHYLTAEHELRYLNVDRTMPSNTSLLTDLSTLVGAGAVANTVVAKLAEEEVHAALGGTGVLGSNLWKEALHAIVRDLFTVGIGEGTQYLLRIERERAPQPSKASHGSPDAEELTRRALDLSGLTREQLAFVMGVRRQSIHNWLGARGGMSPDNRHRLQDVVAVFERARRRLGSAGRVSNWLTKPVREDSSTPLQMLADFEIGAVRGRLLRGAPVRRTAIAPINGTGRVPRRVGAAGYSPPWSQASRAEEFDPEEDGASSIVEEPTDAYRVAPSPRVTGLARA